MPVYHCQKCLPALENNHTGLGIGIRFTARFVSVIRPATLLGAGAA